MSQKVRLLSPDEFMHLGINDFYKYSMGAAAAKKYVDSWARCRFTDRAKIQFPSGYANALWRDMEIMSETPVPQFMLEYMLQQHPYLDRKYVMSRPTLNLDYIHLSQTGGTINFWYEGPWPEIILYETPLMARATHRLNQMLNRVPDRDFVRTAYLKGLRLAEAGARVVEYGTRRSDGPNSHLAVLQAVRDGMYEANAECFMGTSNVAFAAMLGCDLRGTFAHEWVQAHSALFGYRNANQMAMRTWLDVYKGKLATALTDTFTTADFWRTFRENIDLAMAILALRHDSADPIVWANDAVNQLESLGIDPKSKTLFFSDGLNPEKAIKISEHCGTQPHMFGIGTDFTGGLGQYPATKFVIKMVAFCDHQPESEADWIPVVKLSDDPGKHSGSEAEVARAKFELGIQ